MPSEVNIRNIVLSIDPQVRPLAESWLRSLRADGLSLSTQENYLSALRALTRWAAEHGDPIDPTEQTPDMLRRYIVDEMEHLARSTVVLRFNCLKQWFRWLVGEDELDTDPMTRMKAPKPDETVVPVLTEDQLENLLAVTSGRDWLDRRDHAIIRLFIDTGMRLGEMLSVRTANVDLDNQLVALIGTKTKKDRLVPFGDKTTTALDRYKRARDRRPGATEIPQFWLSSRGPLTKHGVAALLNARADQAGVDHLHAHMFRHTAAHRWLSKGGTESDLMRIAGWSNPRMLERYGASAAAERAREAAKRIRLGDSL